MKKLFNPYILFLALAAAVAVNSGGSGAKKAEATEEEHEHEHEEVGGTIATLTNEQIKAVGIELGKIEQRDLTASIKANGVLRVPNENQATVTALFGGVIKTLNVQVGSHVSKGQVVATITNPQFIQLQEEYLSTGSKIRLAEQELARQKELNQGNAGTMRNLQTANADYSALRTRKSSLQQQLQMMGINVSSLSNGSLQSTLVVRSPISGTVSNVIAKIGSYVDVSTPMAEIVDNSSLHLDLQVFERDLGKVKNGQLVNFTLTNNPSRNFQAKVFSIGSSFENDSKTIAVHCNVIGDKAGLIDGMNITGVVNLNNVTSMAVPTDAIVESEGKYFIFVKTDKTAEEHVHESEVGHSHDEKMVSPADTHEGHDHAEKEDEHGINFEKIEVAKGDSQLGYTAIVPVVEIPSNAIIVVKGAFFINAKLTNAGEAHEH